MVKNEAETIAATLRPLLQANIKHFFIFDTGSTDETLSITHKVLQDKLVNYHIVQESFIDFATSRNRALTLAENFFPLIPFILMPDAEWHLYGGEELLRFCEKQLHSATPLFLIRLLMNNTLALYSARLFRTTAKIRFTGVVHEVPSIIAQVKIPDIIFFEFKPSQQSAEKSKVRWKRDLELLSKEYYATINLPDKPTPRTVFYLAQTYECLGDFNKAYEYYSIRVAMQGFAEEQFIAAFRLGRIAEYFSKHDKSFSWEQAQQHYHHAFALRPQRIEPLIYIANHYWPENIPLCYLYANYACNTTYPDNDLLFVEKFLYDYTRYEILSRCAWHMGKFQQGLDATKRALSIHPDMPHLINNLTLYRNKLFEANSII